MQIHTLELTRLAPLLLGHLERSQLPLDAQIALERVESADILVEAMPVYRGSYTGHFKHFFDFVDQNATHNRVRGCGVTRLDRSTPRPAERSGPRWCSAETCTTADQGMSRSSLSYALTAAS